jgi:hypothetical protein
MERDARVDLVRTDSMMNEQFQQSEKQQNIIVEFKDDPFFIALKTLPALKVAARLSSYQARFSEFAADIDALRTLHPIWRPRGVHIRREYYKIFFGSSMRVPSAMMPLIHSLPYVKAIHFDREVHAMSQPHIALIGADSVWAQFGTRGSGVRVGIIDTGVDYLHPALGGGIGTGFKVAGGYDFVNDDSDPMDDNGHGTHVAGIVAANADSVTGVAPEATLYAYKALDASAGGKESDIISAIERAVDPDDNGDPSDRLDIVNMSLGADGGSPTDASSLAVDNAVRLGVLFCIAAGNSGGSTPVEGKENNYFFDGSTTISSPGASELALTVGASDSTDALAIFSSRGPNRISFSIKPEVLAPGVNINSTYPPSGFKMLSGTSMSTPMVTGVAALVKSLHPQWGPTLLKSAIVNTARDLGIGAFLQGGGRVQALKAVSATTLIAPSILSFGIDDPSKSIWQRAETLFVFNQHNDIQTYTLKAAGEPVGMSLDLSPAAFAITPGDSELVIAAITVNNALLPNEDENILRYSGMVSISGTVDTTHVPWAFARASRLVITTSEPNATFLGYTNTSLIRSSDKTVTWTSPTRAEVYGPSKGTYEFFTLFRNPVGKSKILLTEGFDLISDSGELLLDGANAVFPLVYHGVDHQGVSLSSYSASQRTLITSLPNFGDLATTLAGGSDTLLVSAASSSHSFRPLEFQLGAGSSGSMHVVQFDRFTGMSRGLTLTNTPENFIRQHFVVKVPPGTPRAAHITILYNYTYEGGTGGLNGVASSVDTMSVSGDQYEFMSYWGKSSNPLEDIAAIFLTSYSDFEHLSLDYESVVIMPLHDSLVSASREFATPAVPRFESGATMTFGGGPVHIHAIWLNNIIGTSTLHFRTIFRGMLDEERISDNSAGTYSVYDENGAELFTKLLNEPRQPLELTPGRYRVVMTSGNCWLRHARGRATLTSEFLLESGSNAVPPSITALTLLDTNGHTTDSFQKGERGTLLFAFNDIGSSPGTLPIFDSAKAWYRVHGTSEWSPLPLTKVAELVENEGMIVKADLQSATVEDSVAVDLRMAAADQRGFTTDYVVSPAFAVGTWDTLLVTDVPDAGNGNQTEQFALEQNYPNPFNPTTVIRYQLPVAGEAKIEVYDILGRVVAMLVNERKEPGKYETRFNASGLASGVYLYRIEAGHHVQVKKMILLR